MEPGRDVTEGRCHWSDAHRRGGSAAEAAWDQAVRKWLVAAPFLRHQRQTWLHSWVDPRLGFDFEVVPAPVRPLPGPHDARSWVVHLRHAARVWYRAREQSTGIIACFPHLAAALGLHKRLTGARVPIVAWTFHLGAMHGVVSRSLSRFALASVDRFIVHARADIERYRAWLDVPAERLQFVPMPHPLRPVEYAEEAGQPFVLSIGSAHRDYATFAKAMDAVGYRAVVVAAPHALRGVSLPPQVQVRSGVSAQERNELVQKARVVVVPVGDDLTTSGQAALLTAMMYGRPVIATRCAGSVDYVRDGVDGLLVSPGDAQGMAACLQRLWQSTECRLALGANAREGIQHQHSDHAIAGALASVLANVQSGDALPPPGSLLDAPWRDTEPASHPLQ